MDDADTVFIGSPVWGSSPAPAVNSFISQADFKGKNVVIFVTMSGGGQDKAIAKTKNAVEAKGGKVIDSIVIKTGGTKSDDIVRQSEQFAKKFR